MMNNKIKNYDDFESCLKMSKIPSDHYNESLQRIIVDHKKVIKPIYLRTSFIVFFLSIFFTASVAAMQFAGFELFNANKEKVYEILPLRINESDKKLTENMLEYDHIIEKIREEIPEGKFVYFLPIGAYEEVGLTALSALFNGTPINNTSDVPIELESISLRNNLLNNYNLTEGAIYYKSPEVDTETIAEELYTEAKKNDLDYIVQEGTLSSKVNFVELKYKKNERSLGGVTILLNPTDESMYTSENLEEYVKLSDQETEFLYSKANQSLLFIEEDNGQKILVKVFIDVLDENFDVKKELLPIARSLSK